MNTIEVKASKEYSIHIAPALISQIGAHISEIKRNCHIAIISDSNVWPIYGQTVTTALADAGFTSVYYVIPAGEENKNSQTYLDILTFLAESKITRSDILIALGGGVVGDVTGFVAATYLRGIPYVQVPTTLLAMVDSSVGGKTAIDLPAGKNLVGAFYQPSLVLCDITVLETLPRSIFIDGCAEVIKYAILYDAALFDHLQKFGPEFDKEYVITRCISLKRDVVESDEFDTGARQFLNLGHTVGHSIEKNSNYTISHGQAVASGMTIIAKACANYVYCPADVYAKICNILKHFSLPTDTEFSADVLAGGALTDKKRFGQSVNLVLIRNIGECFLQRTPIDELESFFKAGL